MKKWLIGSLCCIVLWGCQTQKPLPSASPEPEVERYEKTDYTSGFDTFLQLIAYEPSAEAFDTRMQEALSLFRQYDQAFDIYHSAAENNLKTINDQAGIAPVAVSDEILEMLLKARDFYELSHHQFDITLGAVLQIWHQYREEGIALNQQGEDAPVPSAQELEQARSCTGWQHVRIDETQKTVYLDDACVSLDVGGIAKGFATEKIAQELEQDPYPAIINAGGNNRTIHTKPDGSDWITGIQNPNEPGDSLIAIPVRGSCAIVTSGDYQRYYIGADGVRYHHIIDPQTGMPANRYRSVTVITRDSGDADALSTTLYTLSLDEGQTVLDEYNQLVPEANAQAIWIYDENLRPEGTEGITHKGFFITATPELREKITTLD